MCLIHKLSNFSRQSLEPTPMYRPDWNNYASCRLEDCRGVDSRKQVRGPQHNMLTIANVNQDIETLLK